MEKPCCHPRLKKDSLSRSIVVVLLNNAIDYNLKMIQLKR